MDREYIKKLAFHAGKGIWKGIPVIGPIVEEVFYEAHKDTLLARFEKELGDSSDEDLAIYEAMMERASLAVEASVAQVHADLLAMASNVDGARDDLLSLKRAIDSLRALLLSTKEDELRDRLQRKLEQLEEDRKAWIGRISRNQRRLLALIPTTESEAILTDVLFAAARKDNESLETARDEELYFRLHELRALGLIRRKWSDPQGSEKRPWLYWRTREGQEVPPEPEAVD